MKFDYQQLFDNGSVEDMCFGLEHLRILTGPICEPCWDCDGELRPATYTDDHHGYAPPTELCRECSEREPGDVGEDDGPLSLDQQMADARRYK